VEESEEGDERRAAKMEEVETAQRGRGRTLSKSDSADSEDRRPLTKSEGR
jgi:hypothetical protein